MARKNARFWLIPLALAVSGLLAFAATWASADRIENDLHSQARTALDDADLSSADIAVDGRDATVSDVPEEQSERARSVVGDIDGVRTVDVEQRRMTQAQKRAQTSIDRVLHRVPIRFAAYSAKPTASGERAVAQLADVMRSTPEGLRFRIGGHAAQVQDLTQREARELSQKRAETVAGELVEAGVDHRRLTTIAHSDTRPAAGSDGESTAAVDKRDRRVEIRVF